MECEVCGMDVLIYVPCKTCPNQVCGDCVDEYLVCQECQDERLG